MNSESVRRKPIGPETALTGARPDRIRLGRNVAVRVSLFYAALAALWIVGSDQWLAGRVSQINQFEHLGILKGLLFVAVSAVGLFLALRWQLRQREREITHWSRVDDALRESQALYLSLVEQMPATVFRKDAAGRYVFVNAGFCRLVGAKPEAYLGKTPEEIANETAKPGQVMLRPDCSLKLMMQDAQHHATIMQTGERIDLEEERILADGSRQYWDVVKSPVFGADGKIIGSQGILFNITGRKRAEEALRMERDLSAGIINQTPAIICRITLDGTTTFINPAGEAVTGYLSNEIVGKNWWRVFYPGDEYRQVEQLFRDFEKGDVRDYEMVLTARSGERRTIAWNSINCYDPSGRVTEIIGFGNDVTERIRAEEELRKLSRAVEQSPAAIVITDLAGKIEYVNPKFTEVSGYAFDEVRGKNPRILKSGETQPDEYQQLWQTISRGEEWRGEFHNRKKNGELFWEFASISSVLDDAGRVTHFVAVKEDITERKRAEAALRESERRFREMMQTVQMATVILDDCGRISFCNDYLLRVTGWERQQVLGKDWFDVFIAPELRAQLRTVYQSLMQGMPVDHYENEIITRRGERRIISWNNTSLKDDGGRFIGVASIGSDITEQKKLEAQFRQTQKMEAIGQLAGGVAHDFNNILAAIMMHLGLLRDAPDLDPSLDESLKELEAETQRAASLTRQLLLFSRRSVMQVKALDVNEVVEQLLKMLRRIIGEHINLQWQACSQLPVVSGDAGMLEQVVMNLVVNARDAMPKGGRIVIATDQIEMDASQVRMNPDARPGRYVCLSVTDSGWGMDEATLKRIFEPFFTTKEAGKGTGLGLATVYGIASQHKGWVNVESEVGQGSTFRIYIPALDRVASDAVAKPQVQPRLGGKETILLVEDEASLRTTSSNFLRQCGYHVIEAGNGMEAISYWTLHWQQIDLLFTDMVMPGGFNGLQMAEKLRAAKPELKVLIASGYSADLVQESDLAGKGILFMAKPASANDLSVAIRRCLDTARV